MGNTEDVVRSIFKTYADKDRAAAEVLVSSDFRFTSPLDDNIDRETYFERCWPNSRNVIGHDLKYVFVQGHQAFVTYECTMRDGKRFRNTEFLVIRDGQVVHVEVYFGWNIPHDVPNS